MGDLGESEVLRGGASLILSKSSKKNLKKQRNLKKSEKSDFFFTENGLKCIRNPTKRL